MTKGKGPFNGMMVSVDRKVGGNWLLCNILWRFMPIAIRQTVDDDTIKKWVMKFDSVGPNTITGFNLGYTADHKWRLNMGYGYGERITFLYALRVDEKRMTVRQGLELERYILDAAADVGNYKQYVRILPLDFDDYGFRRHVESNLRCGHHWSTGLTS